MFKSIVKPGMFCNRIDSTTLATTGTGQPVLTIGNDADFCLVEVRGIVETNGIPETALNLTMSLQGGENFSNGAVDVFSFATIIIDVATTGSVQGYPIRYPVQTRISPDGQMEVYGTVIPANSTVQFALQNLTSNTVIVQIQLWGYKVQKG